MYIGSLHMQVTRHTRSRRTAVRLRVLIPIGTLTRRRVELRTFSKLERRHEHNSDHSQAERLLRTCSDPPSRLCPGSSALYVEIKGKEVTGCTSPPLINAIRYIYMHRPDFVRLCALSMDDVSRDLHLLHPRCHLNPRRHDFLRVLGRIRERR